MAGKNAGRRRTPRSLRVTEAFRDFVLDQLNDLGDVTPRWMFGGVGLYCRGVFFGILARDVLYLKVDDATRSDYEGEPFRPYPGKAGTMQYYPVPVAVLESSFELVEWARKAVAVAERAATVKRRPGRSTVTRT